MEAERKRLGRAAKESVICLAGCVGFCDTLLKSELPIFVESRQHIRACMEGANAVMENIFRTTDPEQAQACMRLAENSQLTVLPNTDIRNNREYVVAEKEAIEELLNDIISDCAFCMKEGKEARRCKRRKNLVRVGIIGEGEKECPYAG